MPEWDLNPESANTRDVISYSLSKNGPYVEVAPEFTGSGKKIYIKIERQILTFYNDEFVWVPDANYNVYYASIVDEIGSESVIVEGVDENNPEDDNSDNDQPSGSGGSQGGGSQGGSTGGTPGGSGEGGSASAGAGGCAGGGNTTGYTMMLMVFSALVVATVKGIKRKKETA
jgi:hypothetical protein